MNITKVFLTDSAWAYTGVYQRVGKLPGIDDRNEKLWTMLGALLLELEKCGKREVIIYNDTRLVQEWNEEVGFLSSHSRSIASRLKDQDGEASRFVKLKVERLDTFTIESEIDKLQLI